MHTAESDKVLRNAKMWNEYHLILRHREAYGKVKTKFLKIAVKTLTPATAYIPKDVNFKRINTIPQFIKPIETPTIEFNFNLLVIVKMP